MALNLHNDALYSILEVTNVCIKTTWTESYTSSAHGDGSKTKDEI